MRSACSFSIHVHVCQSTKSSKCTSQKLDDTHTTSLACTTCLGGGGRGEIDRVAQDAAEQEAGHGAGDWAGCCSLVVATARVMLGLMSI